MKRRIVEVGGTIVLCVGAYLGCYMASSLPPLSLVEPASGTDATFSDLTPDWICFPAWRVKWPKLHTFCAGLCAYEELMR